MDEISSQYPPSQQGEGSQDLSFEKSTEDADMDLNASQGQPQALEKSQSGQDTSCTTASSTEKACVTPTEEHTSQTALMETAETLPPVPSQTDDRSTTDESPAPASGSGGGPSTPTGDVVSVQDLQRMVDRLISALESPDCRLPDAYKEREKDVLVQVKDYLKAEIGEPQREAGLPVTPPSPCRPKAQDVDKKIKELDKKIRELEISPMPAVSKDLEKKLSELYRFCDAEGEKIRRVLQALTDMAHKISSGVEINVTPETSRNSENVVGCMLAYQDMRKTSQELFKLRESFSGYVQQKTGWSAELTEDNTPTLKEVRECVFRATELLVNYLTMIKEIGDRQKEVVEPVMPMLLSLFAEWKLFIEPDPENEAMTRVKHLTSNLTSLVQKTLVPRMQSLQTLLSHIIGLSTRGLDVPVELKNDWTDLEEQLKVFFSTKDQPNPPRWCAVEAVLSDSALDRFSLPGDAEDAERSQFATNIDSWISEFLTRRGFRYFYPQNVMISDMDGTVKFGEGISLRQRVEQGLKLLSNLMEFAGKPWSIKPFDANVPNAGESLKKLEEGFMNSEMYLTIEYLKGKRSLPPHVLTQAIALLEQANSEGESLRQARGVSFALPQEHESKASQSDPKGKGPAIPPSDK